MLQGKTRPLQLATMVELRACAYYAPLICSPDQLQAVFANHVLLH